MSESVHKWMQAFHINLKLKHLIEPKIREIIVGQVISQ